MNSIFLIALEISMVIFLLHLAHECAYVKTFAVFVDVYR
jgi:hypothetical protein